MSAASDTTDTVDSTDSTDTNDTICALATARGEGAVGIVRISGRAALEILRAVSGRRRFAPRRLQLVDLSHPQTAESLDRALVAYMPGPASYTGEDVVEIFGHGGALNMAQLLRAVEALGARPAEPGEFTRRAFLNGRLDLTQAEAVAAVIAARSQEALRNARALLGGALGQRVGALRQRLVELTADLEARIDFADEVDVAVVGEEGAKPGGEHARAARLSAHFTALAHAVDTLVRSYEEGQRLGGVAVGFSGAVNVGKSSLFNALLGSERALVSEEEGTTRDYLEAEAHWEGHRVLLVDTAGERPTMSALEHAGHRLGRERMSRCDLVLRVFDLSQPVPPDATRVQQLEQDGGPELWVGNKADLVSGELRARRMEEGAARAAARGCTMVAVSARSGAGLQTLREAVLDAMFPGRRSRALAEGRETFQITEGRQAAALERARRALVAGARASEHDLPAEVVVEHAREGLTALGEVTGEAFSEDVLDAIFARFCIGK